ncbi:MAG: lipoyl(octanoyl) transferase LipB [Verrucomicrobia bacterium]|nr:MAG: lipoyl(octanoyl) transferase LipB [Verrucomicrobiota bacterium]
MQKIQKIWLGEISFEDGLEIQNNKVNERVKGIISDQVLLLEHEPVYTIGRTQDQSSLPEDRTNLPHPLFITNRGGKATYHGPGQLVGYPILNLKNYKKDLHLYLRSIERSIIKSCIQYGVQASTKEGLTGVWCNDRKIASIGVGVRQWVSMHGFAINVNGDLSPFNEITPCGIQNAEMTNMETEIGGSINFKEFSDSVFENLIEELTLLSQN